jgi:predicted amidohydrolase
MHVHLLQLDIRWEDAAANRRRVLEMVRGHAIGAGDLLLLPEMFDTGFSFNVGVTADRDGASRRFVCDLAREREVTVGAGITVVDGDGRARNRAIVVSPAGEVVATYDKQRLFPLGSPSEAECLTAGDAVTLFEWNGLRVSPLICYDLRFPELFGEGLRAGAQAFALIANWPVDRGAHWRALAIARAIENQAFVFAVNRVGADPKLRYGGGSLVVDPMGVVLAEGDGAEGVVSAAVDPRVLEAWRGRFPSWKARGGV